MPNWIAVIILGLIEGITEFLPVSSTGHLLLVENTGALPPQSDLFNTVIQSGAVLAVLLVFSKRVRDLIQQWRTPEARDYIFKLAAAFLLTAVGGLLAKKLGWTLPKTAKPVAIATLIGGVLFLLVERWLRGRQTQTTISWPIAIAIGVAQLAAGIFPGTSRSGATILAGLAFGVARPAATEFSFLLGIPTLLAAGAYETLKAVKEHQLEIENWPMTALGTAVAAVTAFAVVKWLLRFVQSHTFVAFGWYRIILGAAILLWLGRTVGH